MCCYSLQKHVYKVKGTNEHWKWKYVEKIYFLWCPFNFVCSLSWKCDFWVYSRFAFGWFVINLFNFTLRLKIILWLFLLVDASFFQVAETIEILISHVIVKICSYLLFGDLKFSDCHQLEKENDAQVGKYHPKYHLKYQNIADRVEI